VALGRQLQPESFEHVGDRRGEQEHFPAEMGIIAPRPHPRTVTASSAWVMKNRLPLVFGPGRVPALYHEAVNDAACSG